MSSHRRLARPRLHHTWRIHTPREQRRKVEVRLWRHSCQQREASPGTGRERRDGWECWHFGSSGMTRLAPHCLSGWGVFSLWVLPLGKWNHAARFGASGARVVLSSAEGHTGQEEAVQAQEGPLSPAWP